MRFRLTRVAATLVSTVVAASGCGGSGGGSSGDAGDPVAAQTFVTNQFPTSIPPASTTVAPATTAPTTIAVVPTARLDPVEADRAAIKALIIETDDELDRLINADTPDFTKLQSTGVANSPAVASMMTFVKKFHLDGQGVLRRDIFERGFYEITFEGSDTAKVKSCLRNNSVVFVKNGPSSDDDEVVDDSTEALYEVFTLLRSDGEWRFFTSGGEKGKGETCASAWPY